MRSFSRFTFRTGIVSVSLFVTLIIYLLACVSSVNEPGMNVVSEGKILAGKYCQSCHLLPDPSVATKSIWVDQILPNMGPRLGIHHFREKIYPSSKNSPYIGHGFYPDQPAMTDEEWAEILYYYGYSAPDSLDIQKRNSPIMYDNAVFKAIIPATKYYSPVSTMIGIDTATKQVVQADGFRGYLYIYNDLLQLVDSVKTGRMIVDRAKAKGQTFLCDVGVINPNDGRYGKIWAENSENKRSNEIQLRSVADSLRRPVQISIADLNGDSKEDLVVCEFGNLLGAFSWLENKGNIEFVRHPLREVPGAIHAVIQDYNHDGLPDIWVLFAQGDEKIMLFTNKGNGQFEGKDILRFPSINGSTYFELADFNGDGYPDILYTAGDNADYSRILKPYHGLYVYLNDGNQQFRQQYFFPIHGCFKALARDFDGDGDLDIAAISYFADYINQPEEGFVYLENKGNWIFRASTLVEINYGRWLTLDAGDLDGDGKTDLVLGNSSVGPTPIQSRTDWKSGPPFLWLRNISGSKAISQANKK